MKYDIARQEIKSGDILAWKTNNWDTIGGLAAQIIRIWERSEYSHVGTAVVLNNRVFVIEAVNPLVRIIPLSNKLPCYWTPIGAPWTQKTEQRAFSIIGAEKHKYSIWEALKGATSQVEPGKDTLWQCAELSWYLADSDGIQLGTRIYPSGIVREAQNYGATTLLEE